ncbi:MAG: hypothetical protein K0Q90_1011 [Paenibacillaceae bacterium]|jgi:hypothetical protein|nr:hypothetical protein [Paenibacillaceae bacterium]
MGVLLRKINQFYYVGIDQKIIIVINSSEKILFSIDNIWDYSVIYKFPQDLDFESFNHIYGEEESNGHFLQEQILMDVINSINTFK